MPKQLLESVHSDRFCRVQNLPTSSVELIGPITELYFRQILSTDLMNEFYQDVNTGIGFGSGILLDLVLFADRIIAEPKSNRSILWDMEVCNDLNGVCAFF